MFSFISGNKNKKFINLLKFQQAMEAEMPQRHKVKTEIKTLDDAINLIRQELKEVNLDLKERRFECSLGSSDELRYKGEVIPLHNHHDVSGCEFYADGKPYSILVVDIDPDWGMLNSAAYFGHHPAFRGDTMMMGINIAQPRKSDAPDVPLARTDSHKTVFLGVGPEAEKIDNCLAEVFLPKFADYADNQNL